MKERIDRVERNIRRILVDARSVAYAIVYLVNAIKHRRDSGAGIRRECHILSQLTGQPEETLMQASEDELDDIRTAALNVRANPDINHGGTGNV